MAIYEVAENADEYNYGGVIARISAYLIDCLILFAGLVVLQAALYLVNPIVRIFQSGQQPASWQLHLWVFVTATLPFLFYFALTQSSRRQATIGMRLLKLKVSSANGEGSVSFRQALLRSALMLIPFELNHVVMFHLSSFDAPPSSAFWFGYAGVWILIAAYVGSIFITYRRQSLHDLVASTVVQRSR